MYKSIYRRIPFLTLLISILFSSVAVAQSGKIVGRITDKEFAEELIGASVAVVGTSTGALTDLDGNFTISLKPGTYSLRISYIGYQTQTIKGLEVKAGESTRQDIEMGSEGVQAQEIVVEAELSTATEGALLTQRRKSLAVSDGISSEFIKKTPDSDAGDAIKRTTGVSVMGGKYVFVRGLGERYSNTQLNGVNIPSPEPEKKVVPMDIIPAGLIDNIITIKTFLPDQPGTFAGGLVRIKTKEFPDEFQLNASVSSGFNSNAHFNDTWRYDGGGLDFLGIDDGERKLPNFGDNLKSFNKNQLASALGQFNSNTYLPSSGQYSPNKGFSLAIANQLSLMNMPLGFIANVTYSSGAKYKEQTSFFPRLAANEYEYLWNSQIATYDVNWGGVLNFTTKLNKDNKIGLKTTYNRTAEDEAMLTEGNSFYESDILSNLIRTTRLRFVERQMWSSQLSGSHYLGWLAKSEVEWKAQYASAKRYEPDNRETQYLFDESLGEYTYNNDYKRNGRFFSDLDDNEVDLLMDLSVPFKQWSGFKGKVKIGGLFTSKNREFWARRFKFQSAQGNYQGLTPEELFTSENVANGTIRFEETTDPSDEYTADETIMAGYAMVELPLLRTLRFIGGARVEKNDIKINSFDSNSRPVEGGFEETNILPSLNLIYELNDQMNLRGSFSQTIANPELRELAPFRFDSYRTAMVGNPFLEQTNIDNYDIRWEWFPKFGELIAVSLFYKNIDKPLEVVSLAGFGSTPEETTNNGKTAKNYGVEFEFRKRMDFISESLSNFSLSTNITLVQSEIEQGEFIYRFNTSSGELEAFPVSSSLSGKRKMQGQSPYVINFNMGYENSELGLSGTLLYNIVGERIYQLNGNPNFSDNFVEQSRHQLDLSLSKKLAESLKMKFNIKNILNDRYLIMFGDDEAETYKTGTSYSISFSYAL
jgi:outer membrane receptor protein involved in Fe transport